MKHLALPHSALPPAPPACLLFPPVEWQPWDKGEWLAFFRARGIEPSKVVRSYNSEDRKATVYEVEE